MTELEFLRLAEEIAREAGDMLLAKRPTMSGEIETKSSPTDVVTALDKASEELIRERILAARPADRILGEEGGEEPGESDVRWIVDPIDGTVNFLYGLPDWAVSIAVEVRGEIVAGVVNVAPRGEVFTAARGHGAWLGPQRLRCNTGVPLSQALVSTGFGYDKNRRAVQGEVVAQVLPRVRDIRRGGSCAVDLCSLAAGRVDAYYERGINHWDFAAAGLVATESGARLAGLNGRPVSPDYALCAAPGLFEELHDLLVPLNPERDA
ncbi:Inositol-1-monophosphatase [[Actinomadura] parvosata subsp. kistnae]|uniref:Inositol-1-monophosphatase n=1 Tax=[Actinomadura] parvosata subsp. kistnae TaxID=1909395 RepID=A0A1U9ZQI3_9ACTN|nr:inositol monophosphatase family protein [Nonomuraea sp. ATCC 55076]AQZ60197.1 inositol monophosphatase [Nonomuraea sp. ATCC 55076]SPL91326.1 Inositol-1-monophosphatase [Actinomadura parvosata subsp. kistnae]